MRTLILCIIVEHLAMSTIMRLHISWVPTDFAAHKTPNAIPVDMGALAPEHVLHKKRSADNRVARLTGDDLTVLQKPVK